MSQEDKYLIFFCRFWNRYANYLNDYFKSWAWVWNIVRKNIYKFPKSNFSWSLELNQLVSSECLHVCECEGVQSEGGRKKEGGGQIKGMGIYSKNYCIIENFCAGKEVCVFIFSENSILGSVIACLCCSSKRSRFLP